jgi:plasmid stabilization system protein ParE
MLRLTPRAAEALRAADAAARRFNPEARVRLRRSGAGVAADLTEGPDPGETAVVLDGIDLIVAEDLEGTVDADDHNAFSLRV